MPPCRENTECTLTNHGIKSPVRKWEILRIATFKLHPRVHTFGLRQRPRSRDILFAVVDAKDFAPELFREEDCSRPFAARHVPNRAGRTQPKHAPQLPRQLQATRMERVTEQGPASVAFIQRG